MRHCRLATLVLLAAPPALAQRPVASFTSMNPVSATAGGPDFLLGIQGSNLVGGMVVRWNGEDRPTQVSANGAVQATISASDIAQPGTAEVSVYHPATGVTLGTRTFFIGFALPAAYLLADPTRDLIYAALQNLPFDQSATDVAIVDPEAPAVTARITVGKRLGAMAISDDAQYLYVAVNGEGVIRRIDLTRATVDLTIPLPAGASALDLAVMPGAPETIAVVVATIGTSASVAIYDRAVRRPNISKSATTTIAFADSTTLYTGFGPTRLTIDSNGIATETDVKLTGYYPEIRYSGGLLYFSGGIAYDPVASTFTCDLGLTGDPVFDLPDRRALLISHTGLFQDARILGAVDLAGCTPLGEMELPSTAAQGRGSLVLWGRNGVAFPGGTLSGYPVASNIFILRTALASPPPAVTAIRGTIAPGQVIGIIGSSLGPTPTRDTQYSAPGQISTKLVGVEVMFDGSFAPILSAAENELRVIVPADAGSARPTILMQVVNGGIPSPQIPLVLGATDPAVAP